MKRMLALFAATACFALQSAPLHAAEDVTFTRDIAPIFYENCVQCHRPGEVAPFSLLTYKDAVKHSEEIVETTKTRLMPPWKAEKGHGEFLAERRLTDEQIQLIQTWNDTGNKEGNPADMPKPPTFSSGWTLGEPDLVLEMSEEFTVPASGRDVYRWFVIPAQLKEEKYVRALEFRPSNPRVVHHALFFLDTSGTGRKLDAAAPGAGYPRMGGPGFLPSGSLGGWAPGVTPQVLTDGVARVMQAKSDFVFQVHFHPTGKVEKEKSRVGLYFADKKPEKVLATFASSVRPLRIPAGESNFKVSREFVVPVDTTLFGIIPHAHMLCQSIRVTATTPDGETFPLIYISKWDWNWQDQYTYKNPIPIKAGTKLYQEFIYDNSSNNINNPSNPPRLVKWGEQTTDEMAMVFFQVLAEPDSTMALLGGAGKSGFSGGDAGPVREALQEMVLKRFDKNKNGKLDPDERREAMQSLGR